MVISVNLEINHYYEKEIKQIQFKQLENISLLMFEMHSIIHRKLVFHL